MARQRTIDTLRREGWQRIASDAHAAQLLRRELKHHAKMQQRNRSASWDYRRLLQIKPGNWYKFLRNPRNVYCSILIWIIEEVTANTPANQPEKPES